MAVGAVRSTVTEEVLRLLAGPVLPAESATEEAARRSTTVPSEQDDAVTVIEEPEAAEGVNTQPVAVPVLVKSELLRPYTASEKAKVYESDTALVVLEG